MSHPQRRLTQDCFLPNGDSVTVHAVWQWEPGANDGSITNQRGWELIEYWLEKMPHASIADRAFVSKQLNGPDEVP